MISSLRIVFTLLLVVSTSALAQGQTVLDDFEGVFDNFLHFGAPTVDSGFIEDCGTIGNHCNSHTANFTEDPFDPNLFGIGELGPFLFPETIDLSGFIGYSIDARFIRTGIADPNALIPQTDFTGLSPIKFGVQWDPTDACGGSMNACSDLYDTPVELTETFQTFTVMFDDFLMGMPRNSAQIKMLMLTGDFDPSLAPNKKLHGGDFNANSEVSGEDFLTWQRHFGETVTGGGAPAFINGNANIDPIIDGADLAIWEAQYATDAPISDWSNGVGRFEFDNIIGILPPPLAGASAIPEPSSCCLILCCASLLIWNTRSKRQFLSSGEQRCRVGRRGTVGSSLKW